MKTAHDLTPRPSKKVSSVLKLVQTKILRAVTKAKIKEVTKNQMQATGTSVQRESGSGAYRISENFNPSPTKFIGKRIQVDKNKRLSRMDTVLHAEQDGKEQLMKIT